MYAVEWFHMISGVAHIRPSSLPPRRVPHLVLAQGERCQLPLVCSCQPEGPVKVVFDSGGRRYLMSLHVFPFRIFRTKSLADRVRPVGP